MMDAGLAGRLKRNGRQEAPHISANPALDEAQLRRPLAARGAIEIGAVEPAVIDISEEVRRGQQRVTRIERNHDCPFRGVDADPYQPRRCFRRGLGRCRGSYSESREREDGEEEGAHSLLQQQRYQGS